MAEAAYRKYPNPYNPNVRSLDTLERRAAPGRLFSHRLFSTMWNIPQLVLNVSIYWRLTFVGGLGVKVLSCGPTSSGSSDRDFLSLQDALI